MDVFSSGKQYPFSINMQMNRLNVESLLLTKQLKKGEYYDFDYDNQIIGVATIGEKIVYVENRNGNANVKTRQASTLGSAIRAVGGGGGMAS